MASKLINGADESAFFGLGSFRLETLINGEKVIHTVFVHRLGALHLFERKRQWREKTVAGVGLLDMGQIQTAALRMINSQMKNFSPADDKNIFLVIGHG